MSKELAADYFSRHLSSNECHITSDGRVFHTKGAADSFANGLKDDKVASHKRDEKAKDDTPKGDGKKTKIVVQNPIDAPKDDAPKDDAPKDDAPKDDAPKDDAPKDDAPKVYTLEDLKAFDTTTASYPEIKALVNGLGLESPSQKQVDLIAAIEAQKVIINSEIKE